MAAILLCGLLIVATAFAAEDPPGSPSSAGAKYDDTTGCFAAGTRITLPSGEYRAIEYKKVGLRVLSYGGESTVISDEKMDKVAMGTLFGINDEKPFASPSTPFLTIEGWKVIDPKAANVENPFTTYGTLHEGDTVFRIANMDPLLYEPIKIKQITFTTLSVPTKVYGMHFKGYKTFHANGYVVASNYPVLSLSRVMNVFMNMNREDQEGAYRVLSSSKTEIAKVVGRWYYRFIREMEKVARENHINS